MSNYAPAEQLVETVPYRIGKKGTGCESSRCLSPISRGPTEPLVDVQAVQVFARDFAGLHKGKWIEVERLAGFCFLVRRAVLDRVRPNLDEWTDLSLFDTDILSSKARQAGFTLVSCRDRSSTTSGRGSSPTGRRPQRPASRMDNRQADGHERPDTPVDRGMTCAAPCNECTHTRPDTAFDRGMTCAPRVTLSLPRPDTPRATKMTCLARARFTPHTRRLPSGRVSKRDENRQVS